MSVIINKRRKNVFDIILRFINIIAFLCDDLILITCSDKEFPWEKLNESHGVEYPHWIKLIIVSYKNDGQDEFISYLSGYLKFFRSAHTHDEAVVDVSYSAGISVYFL